MELASPMAKVKYEPMLVSYVDILGFGELIKHEDRRGDFKASPNLQRNDSSIQIQRSWPDS